jgi:hypothetical protein
MLRGASFDFEEFSIKIFITKLKGGNQDVTARMVD